MKLRVAVAAGADRLAAAPLNRHFGGREMCSDSVGDSSPGSHRSRRQLLGYPTCRGEPWS